MQTHRFTVNLAALIDLLSAHLYSGPRVFMRELLQNAVDAVRARSGSSGGRVRIDVDSGRSMVVEDNGVGLEEDEIHRFLATIGESSKRGRLDELRRSFLGQFGIGLLSCFMVSDTITVITRSCKGGPAWRWDGSSDGTYRLTPGPDETPAGCTRVLLSCKPERSELFQPGEVCRLAEYYGSCLTIPIEVTWDGQSRLINQPPPWRLVHPDAAEQRQALLQYGQRLFDMAFIDAVPLRSSSGDVSGVAYILPFACNPGARPQHRVYLKDMLLSESVETPWHVGGLPMGFQTSRVHPAIPSVGLHPTSADTDVSNRQPPAAALRR